MDKESVVRKFRTTAIEETPMYMKDYIDQLDAVLSSSKRPLLKGAGNISNKQAIDKAVAEYRKYQVNTLSPVEKEYLEAIKQTVKEVKSSLRGK